VVIPVIIAAVNATSEIMAGGSWGDISIWLQIIITFDFIYAVIATLVFEFVVEE